jgi:glutamine---fructose-6-phosphate transaminase (isomerizing)
MCGIIGAVAKENITPKLLNGLHRLEYRGYDSAGVAVINDGAIQCRRTHGRVKKLEKLLQAEPIQGNIGIAHTRWATHGEPSEENAHPHISSDQIALVHNGIIENEAVIREKLLTAGYQFNSDTDSELIAHLIHFYLQAGEAFLTAVNSTTKVLSGAFALGVINRDDPTRLIAVRHGSPLVIGLADSACYLASDHLALTDYCHRFIFLEEGDVADISLQEIQLYDQHGQRVERLEQVIHAGHDAIDKGPFRHYMLKETYEQPEALIATLAGRISKVADLDHLVAELTPQLAHCQHLHIIACGTSYHAGLVAKYWLEAIAGVNVCVEVASEYRYRHVVVPAKTIFIAISQSGETADTLAALHKAKQLDYQARLALCNVDKSSLARQADSVLLTRAGVEIGVASTKAFTTQLCALLLFTLSVAKQKQVDEETLKRYLHDLQSLPARVHQALSLNTEIAQLAERFVNKHHALFLGRGIHYPIACEGALKLKEISYIHAEAYPAGELKHGPLALVDNEMPVIAVAPNNELLAKLTSNLHEVRARGGELIVFADSQINFPRIAEIHVIPMPAIPNSIAPIVYTVPLQLLAYHVAVLKGTDIDQPRNLAKSVTVE